MKAKPIPDGYHTVTPYLIVKGATSAIDFYKRAFGAQELMRFPGPGGTIMHAEIKIGDSPIMLADEFPQMNALSPQTIGGTPMFIALYVENVDKLTAQAIAAGAKVEQPVKNQFYGDRSRHRGRSIWTSLDHRHAHRRRVDGRDAAPDGRHERAAGLKQ